MCTQDQKNQQAQRAVISGAISRPDGALLIARAASSATGRSPSTRSRTSTTAGRSHGFSEAQFSRATRGKPWYDIDEPILF